ncbi:uncharacterized protein DDB_G0283357-like [Ruditapes philippinarum]|uniref:uncharacterized protein DDB_G0283357-like n=1 Tax=Ruditapes philippinarum TaxID=129788 RepID=UPI00295B74A4|nr:uncharacterized protein DDB_G0283357-like [Ruditapes philippinarum]
MLGTLLKLIIIQISFDVIESTWGLYGNNFQNHKTFYNKDSHTFGTGSLLKQPTITNRNSNAWGGVKGSDSRDNSKSRNFGGFGGFNIFKKPINTNAGRYSKGTSGSRDSSRSRNVGGIGNFGIFKKPTNTNTNWSSWGNVDRSSKRTSGDSSRSNKASSRSNKAGNVGGWLFKRPTFNNNGRNSISILSGSDDDTTDKTNRNWNSWTNKGNDNERSDTIERSKAKKSGTSSSKTKSKSSSKKSNHSKSKASEKGHSSKSKDFRSRTSHISIHKTEQNWNSWTNKVKNEDRSETIERSKEKKSDKTKSKSSSKKSNHSKSKASEKGHSSKSKDFRSRASHSSIHKTEQNWNSWTNKVKNEDRSETIERSKEKKSDVSSSKPKSKSSSKDTKQSNTQTSEKGHSSESKDSHSKSLHNSKYKSSHSSSTEDKNTQTGLKSKSHGFLWPQKSKSNRFPWSTKSKSNGFQWPKNSKSNDFPWPRKSKSNEKPWLPKSRETNPTFSTITRSKSPLTTTERTKNSEHTTEDNGVFEPTTEKNSVTEPTTEGNAVTKPTTGGNAVTEPTTEGNAVTEPTTEGNAVTETTTEGKGVTEPTTEGNDVTEPTPEKNSVTEPTTEESIAVTQEKEDLPTFGPTLKPPYKGPKICQKQTPPCCVGGKLTVDLNRGKNSKRDIVDGVTLLQVHKGEGRNKKQACSSTALVVVNFDKIDTAGCFGCLEAPYCGKRMLKIELRLSNARRSGWLFNVGDSESNNGYRGDDNEQMNDAETQGLFPNITVYPSDNCPSINSLMHIVHALADNVDTVTLYISNEHIRITNSEGLDFKLCHSCLYALNGQPDEGPNGVPNETICIGLNRVVKDITRSGYGVCSATFSWECPWCT